MKLNILNFSMCMRTLNDLDHELGTHKWQKIRSMGWGSLVIFHIFFKCNRCAKTIRWRAKPHLFSFPFAKRRRFIKLHILVPVASGM